VKRGVLIHSFHPRPEDGEGQSIPRVCTPAQRTGLNTTTVGASGRGEEESKPGSERPDAGLRPEIRNTNPSTLLRTGLEILDKFKFKTRLPRSASPRSQ